MKIQDTLEIIIEYTAPSDEAGQEALAKEIQDKIREVLKPYDDNVGIDVIESGEVDEEEEAPDESSDDVEP